ncbi:MAG: ABC transporter ATP-binding protein [Pseudobdellovibrionaceae bacterium]
MNVFEFEKVHKSFPFGFWRKPRVVLNQISFSVHAGKVTGFVGSNGAGKTTSIKCLLGFIFPDSGQIRYFGNQKFSDTVKSKIGYLPERPYFYDFLTGTEFLRMHWQLSDQKGGRKEFVERSERLLKKVDLLGAAHRPLRSYSKGMLQRIGIAQALLANPEVLILDEPMSGLDPEGRYTIKELMREIALKDGATLFFSSHLLQDMEELCSELVVVDHGELKYQGEILKLLQDVSGESKIVFRNKTGVVESCFLAYVNLQKKIDELRSGNSEIIEVQKSRLKLEEAFQKIKTGQK